MVTGSGRARVDRGDARRFGQRTPSGYAQARAPGNVPPYVPRSPSLPPTEIECLRAESAQMRIEAQERDERVEALEELLTRYGVCAVALSTEAVKELAG